VENRGALADLRTLAIAGIVVILATSILAAALVLVALRWTGPPAATPAVIVVTATPPNTPAPPPSPTPSPLPTATPPATLPLVPAGWAMSPACRNVSGDELSVRAGPGTEYDPPLGALSPGQEAAVIGKNAQQATWWKIEAGELRGWVSARLCAGDFDANRVAVLYILPATRMAGGAVTLTPTPSPVPTPVPTPAPTPLAGRLYFPVYDPQRETYDIFSANLDGSDRRELIKEASQPAVDAGGGRIAYKSWQADARGMKEHPIQGGEVWIFDPHFEGARAAFSPDGGALLFHSREGGEKLAVYRTVGREHEVLRREAQPIQGEAPAWLPNGAQFVYKGCLGNDCGLILSNLDGSFPRQLTQNLSDTNPSAAPDGQTLAFMSQTGGSTWDIYTVGVNGSNRTQLTVDLARDGLPIWSRDGTTIVFVSDRGGAWAAWAMDADGGRQRWLFELGGPVDGLVAVDVQNSHGWLEESIAWAP
jgi:hypothetical protein